MRNLDWLYDTDEPFRNAVCGAAAEWLGSTSENFADAWLRERHHEDDEACLLGHHMEAGEVDTREKLEADLREQHANAGWLRALENADEIDRLQAELDKRDNGIERLKHRRDELQEELAQVKRKYAEKLADVRTLPTVDRMRELEGEVERLRMDCEDWEADWEKSENMRIEAESERDAYRELCGKFRAMANEMLVMEVDEC